MRRIRNDLRRIVQILTDKEVRIDFIKEQLSFTGEDSPMATLLLSVMGAFAEFERALLKERQREGIALAKQRGGYRGRKRSFAGADITVLQSRVAAGEKKAQIARDLGMSRETVHHYLKHCDAR